MTKPSKEIVDMVEAAMPGWKVVEPQPRQAYVPREDVVASLSLEDMQRALGVKNVATPEEVRKREGNGVNATMVRVRPVNDLGNATFEKAIIVSNGRIVAYQG